MKKSLINIIQIWMTEMKEIMHDKGILVFIIFVPLCYPLLYSYVYTNEVVREVPFAVIDECNSAQSREFIRKMDATPDARLAARCNNVDETQQLKKAESMAWCASRRHSTGTSGVENRPPSDYIAT